MANLESLSQLGLAFFGLTSNNIPQARAAVFTQIHEIVFHGNGGYDWNTIYNMPIWLRRFTFNKINAFNTKQNENIENPQDGSPKNLINADGTVNTQVINNSINFKYL